MNLHSLAKSCPASRALLVQRVLREGWSVVAAAEACGLSVRRANEWLARARAGEEEFRDRSSAPQRKPTKTPDEWERVIIELRRCRLTAKRIAELLKMPRSTVSRILQRHGLSRAKNLLPTETPMRYERKEPGELVHLDVKKLGRFLRVGHRISGNRQQATKKAGWDFVHVCIDDASRVAYVEVLDDEKGETTAEFLRRAASWFLKRGVVVQRVLTDNGSCYRSRDFGAACAEIAARHLRTRPYRPQTNGKAERLIQTLMREWAYAVPYQNSQARVAALPRWLRYYNQTRPHTALGNKAPATRLGRPGENNVMGSHS